MEFNLSYYLKDYIGKIVILSVTKGTFPLWKRNRQQYVYTGIFRDENLRQILDDEIVIEFDKKEDIQLPFLREQSERMISRIAYIFEQHNIGFHVSDHGGISPHFRTRILGLSAYPHSIRKKYKLGFVKDILNEIGFKPKILQLDKSLILSEMKLIPLEERPHWKPKYHGAIEKVIRFSNKSYSRVVPEKIQKFSTNSHTRQSLRAPSFYPSNVRIDIFQNIFNLMYRNGRRHYTVSIIARLLKKHKYTKEQAREFVISLLNKCPSEKQENNKDLISFSTAFDDGHAPGGLIKLAFPDAWFRVYNDLESCFEVDV